ncbi:MAG: hypothetical protein QE271_07215 [Bacteriovoracaceae bacterium]|nr:hypothetical protein [Bacteriovoracaceae bacterium]
MKAIINYLSDPVFSFTGIIFFFFLGIKHIEVVASKKFATIALILILIIFGWMSLDPVFLSIVIWPDNVPIIFLLALVIWSTWFAIHKGVINDQRMAAGEPPVEGTPENREKVWAWPNLVYTELFAIIAGTVFLIAWSILLKSPLEEPANPTWAPNPAKAPWYFLGLQEMLVYFDPWIAGVTLPVLIVVGLIAIPYIDTNPKGNGYYSFKDRKFAITSFLFGWLLLWIFLIIIGTFLRGPNWTFYGPFEFWDAHKVVAANNINLSEIFWIKFLNMPLPKNIFAREFLGLILVAIYYTFVPVFITRKFGQKFLITMGKARYYFLIFLVLTMMSLPLKMYLRWFINLKYIVFMPEFELNI